MPLNDDDFMRYSRHLLMSDIGESGQQKLSQARVLIVGMGGLGCPVSLYLAAAGVGSISICDPDRVDKTNLQRQILYETADCGNLKVACAKDRLQALNPSVVIDIFPCPVDHKILAGNYDVVIDCTDNLAARQLINRVCYAEGVPFVSAAAIGWEGQLVMFDFAHCRGLCFNCIINHSSAEPMMNCANSGVVGPVLGVMGSMQAITVMRTLLGVALQHGEVQRYDGKRGQWCSLQGSQDKECSVCSLVEFKG
ncbi:MAG: HesA/MoeB/ThiF family protein [Porticoccaceae bacterium]|nr:HesA/MoeB/ThiF family protein [Porticoccaceae bacterium]MBT6780286.1 HesA/MoeB/ThiF family protein [Porticoccaceae bacterium]